MIKQEITYNGFDDKEYTEDFFFNLTEAEVAEMELSQEGGLSAVIHQIIAAKDVEKIVKLFKELIKKSYGVKSLDNKRFIKSEQIWDDFVSTNAYSWLFTKLSMDAEFSAKFVTGILNTIKRSEK